MWKLISDYSQTIRGSGYGGGQGVYYSQNVNPHGKGSGPARIRKNMFEFIREKVLPTTTSSGDRFGGVTSHVGSHPSTSGSSYEDHCSHSAQPPIQKRSSSVDDDEGTWDQMASSTAL